MEPSVRFVVGGEKAMTTAMSPDQVNAYKASKESFASPRGSKVVEYNVVIAAAFDRGHHLRRATRPRNVVTATTPANASHNARLRL